DLRPAEILARANSELCRENEELMFVTMLCGILDLGQGELTIANGGHLSPVLLSPDSFPVAVETPPGLVLGVRNDFVYADTAVTIPAGGTLVLFTDGVTETSGEGGSLFGMGGVLAMLSEAAGSTPESLVRELVARARRSSTFPADDIAILALEYRGGGGGGQAAAPPSSGRKSAGSPTG
ncbi:MAG TPA: PP2C family protein-serine/threonine phosphatase, partial [Verrucomicrobiae bacterium]|nr:PP2C family protein-serine/threonine phosphatase [Verrucomicrobiae bacterium]